MRVLYILSSQRSGSTLLDRMLGQMPGCFSTGELRYIWHRGLIERQLCGCGEPLPLCPFWSVVVERFKACCGGAVDIPEIDTSSQMIQHYRFALLSFVPALLQRKTAAGRITDRLAKILSLLYREIQSVSGARLIVDSSKSYPYALILAGVPEIELHIVHLFRDSRAVAFSNLRLRPRPEIRGREATMKRLSLLESCTSWNTVHAFAPTLRLKGITSYRFIRYEDLIREPAKVLKDILFSIGEDPHTILLDFIKDQQVYLKSSHTVAGNPMRFNQGVIALRLDEEWRQKMSASQKNTVTLLTLPLSAAYKLIPSR